MTESTSENPRRELFRNWLEIIAITLVVLAIGVRAYGTVLSKERLLLEESSVAAQERFDACISSTIVAAQADQCGKLRSSLDAAVESLQSFDTPVRKLVIGLALSERAPNVEN